MFLFISLLIIATACYDDMGNYDYSSLPDVAITAKDTAYATQFKTLELSGRYKSGWGIRNRLRVQLANLVE